MFYTGFVDLISRITIVHVYYNTIETDGYKLLLLINYNMHVLSKPENSVTLI